MPFQTMGSGGSRIGSAHGGRFTGEFMATRGAANGRPIYEGSRGGQYHMTPGELVCKIRPEFFPHLKYLTVNSVRRAIVQWWTLPHSYVFSNGFPHLYKACLTSVALPSTITTWTGSSSIRELEICWISRPRFLGTLLLSCPNLYKFKIIVDQFYSIHGTLGYHDDGFVEVDENSIPHGIVIHRALRHLEIECVNAIGLFEFLESLL
ncbi:unnamed protein product, partial [Adineta steineri]